MSGSLYPDGAVQVLNYSAMDQQSIGIVSNEFSSLYFHLTLL